MVMNYLTKEGYERFQQELDELLNVERPKLAKLLCEALEGGDPAENIEFFKLKEEQAFLEGRIIDLQTLLAQAQIIQKKKSTSIEIGSLVSIQEEGWPKENMQTNK